MSSVPSGSGASEATTIAGPAGALEALVDVPARADHAFVAVVCHPHPLFGGTMLNKVAHILARAFNEAGAVAVRFNYRGVGASAGGYDEGRGETDDTLSVLDWAHERWPDTRLALAGFSFGGAVAIRAASARADVQRLVTVAPAVDRVAVAAASLPRCPWLLLQGDRDELVDPGAVTRWVSTLATPPEVVMLPGAEHFFHGRLNDIRSHVVDWLQRVG